MPASKDRASRTGRWAATRKPALGWARIGYGVDVRGSRVVVARATRSGRRVVCEPVADAARVQADAAAGSAVCAACLSPRESLTRWIEAPFAARRKSVRVLPTVLDIELPFAIEDCVYTFLDVHATPARRTRALAVVATRAAVEARLAALEAHRIDPLVLDQEGLAVWTQGLWERPVDRAQGERLRAVLVMEGDASSVTIGRGTEFVNGYAVRLADAARIVRLVRAQAQGADAAMQWLLVGSGAEQPEAVAAVTRMLDAEQWGDYRVVDEPARFVARALAQRAITAGPLRCNLRLGEWVHARVRRHAQRHRLRAAGMVLAAGLLLCGVNIAVQWRATRLRAQSVRALETLVDELAGYPVTAKGRDALGVVRDQVAERKQALRPFVHAFDPSLAQRLVHVLEVAQREGMRCERISMNRAGVTLDGVAPDWDRVDLLAREMEAAGYDVDVERKESLSDETVAFTIFSKDQP